ncbi:Pulcherriminic acid synthase (plasmid) [Streptomyces sp. SudanB66_2053]
MPDILSSQFEADPYPAYAVMREKKPLIRHEATKSYIPPRYEDVERVFKDKKSEFTTENYDWQLQLVHGKTILQLSGREHAVRRALVAPGFRGSDLQDKFLPVLECNSRELIGAFRHTGSADLVGDYATRFPVNVIADMLSLEKSDHTRFHRWYTAVIALLGNLSGDPEVAAAGERTRGEFAEYMIPIIRHRRDHLGDDLLSTSVEPRSTASG